MRRCSQQLSAVLVTPWPIQLCCFATAGGYPLQAGSVGAQSSHARHLRRGGVVSAPCMQAFANRTGPYARQVSNATHLASQPLCAALSSPRALRQCTGAWHQRHSASIAVTEADAAPEPNPASAGLGGTEALRQRGVTVNSTGAADTVQENTAQHKPSAHADAASDDVADMDSRRLADVGWRRRWGKAADRLAKEYLCALQAAKAAHTEPEAMAVRPYPQHPDMQRCPALCLHSVTLRLIKRRNPAADRATNCARGAAVHTGRDGRNHGRPPFRATARRQCRGRPRAAPCIPFHAAHA